MSSLLNPQQFAEASVQIMTEFPDHLINNDFPNHTKYHYDRLASQYQLNHANSSRALQKQFLKTAEWDIKNDIDLEEPQAVALGAEAFFCRMGNVGLRMSPKYVQRIVHPLILPALFTARGMWSKSFDNWKKYIANFKMINSTIEVVPLVDCSQNTEHDVEQLREAAEKSKLNYHDYDVTNQGLYSPSPGVSPRQVIIDPGSVERGKPKKIIMGPGF